MLARRIFLSTALATCAAIGLAATPLATFSGQSGSGSGSWVLPSGSGTSDGYLSGTLYLSPAGTFRFAFNANLTDVPTPCLSCITGTIDGTLDDGVGPAPDYLVKGTYSGVFVTGKGSFSCEIRTLTGTVVGKIDGTFADPPASSTPGTFKCTWSIP